MKRDMNLIRKILFSIEEQYIPGSNRILNFKVDFPCIPTVAEHCELLYQAGFIGKYEPHRIQNAIHEISVGNLTSQGYDYLELIRNEDTWNKTKETVKENNLPETIESYGKVAASILGTFFRELNR